MAEDLRSIEVFGNAGEAGVTPLSKVQAITQIYFPQFKVLIEDVAKKSDSYELWMLKAGKKRLNNEDNYTDGFNEEYVPYAAARSKVMTEIGEFSQKEFS